MRSFLSRGVGVLFLVSYVAVGLYCLYEDVLAIGLPKVAALTAVGAIAVMLGIFCYYVAFVWQNEEECCGRSRLEWRLVGLPGCLTLWLVVLAMAQATWILPGQIAWRWYLSVQENSPWMTAAVDPMAVGYFLLLYSIPIGFYAALLGPEIADNLRKPPT